MNLTTEQVHWLFGGAIVAAALLLVLRESGRVTGSWLDYVTPTVLIAFGAELLFDPLVHGAATPANYAMESSQHFALGLLVIATGAAEIFRVRRNGEGWRWRVPFAAMLMIAAGIFALHAQHDSSAPMILLVAQHRVIAATLMLAALAFLFAPPLTGTRTVSAFSALLLILGLEFLLYTEGSSVFGEWIGGRAPQEHSR